jgi:hypothetical protein
MHLRKSSFEFYGKVYDDLTKAIQRAKWICRQNNANRMSICSSSSKKRGRPVGSKNSKPRVKKDKDPEQVSKSQSCMPAVPSQRNDSSEINHIPSITSMQAVVAQCYEVDSEPRRVLKSYIFLALKYSHWWCISLMKGWRIFIFIRRRSSWILGVSTSLNRIGKIRQFFDAVALTLPLFF